MSNDRSITAGLSVGTCSSYTVSSKLGMRVHVRAEPHAERLHEAGDVLLGESAACR